MQTGASAFPSVRYTLDDAVRSLGLAEWHKDGLVDYAKFAWPPDTFAVAASILRESGAYLQASRPLSDAIPTEHRDAWQQRGWCKRVLDAAMHWRRMEPPILVDHYRARFADLQLEQGMARSQGHSEQVSDDDLAFAAQHVKEVEARFMSWDARAALPRRVIALLDALYDMRGTRLCDLSKPATESPLWLVLLELLAIADEASRGVGLMFQIAPPTRTEAFTKLTDASAQPSATPRKKPRSRSAPSPAPSSTTDPRAAEEHALTDEPWKGYPEDSWVAWASIAIITLQLGVRDRFERDDPRERADLLEVAGAVQRKLGHESPPDFRPITLCWRVDPSRAIVLPKMRTSQRGVTIRSFSLHLSLLCGSDVEAVWNPPTTTLLKRPAASASPVGKHQPSEVVRQAGPYNLVLLPWPHLIRPRQFRPARRSAPPDQALHADHEFECLGGRPTASDRFFTFDHEQQGPSEKQLKDLLSDAEERVGAVHGLVMPEMSLTRAQFNTLFATSMPEGLDFLACGVYEPAADGLLGRNYVIIRQRNEAHPKRYTQFIQEKHHRWALDPGQVAQYSIGSSLRGKETWWEAIDLPRRALHIVAVDSYVAVTVLVCEDLARPDPVADAIRAVGPNLVVCLLLDGPQLKDRWSARYATVLADDPGSSVLTVSSLGMVNLSRMRDRLHECSRVVALWREARGTPVELHLPDGSHGLVISLTAEELTERTIDGRVDAGTGTLIRLAGVHPVSWRAKA
jgi:hypothetical protein